ncbi:MAG: hypothetical protein A4S09_03835 [Proteobacteria bacterium SG_bin7]|nr:MAG: hypothetical protein A4S09_03835 [Proteobacteria bacterium SG_bin7]
MTKNQGLSHQNMSFLKSAIDEAAIVAITDRQGVITYANKKFCSISGYAQDELIGSNHRIVNSGYHSKDYFVSMWKTISSGKVWEGEICNRAKSGNLYWVNTTIVPFMNEQGRPEAYVAVRYEITERKLAEENLKINSKKLEISNRELQDFASIAAHDLQEPLRKILTFLDRIKLKVSDKLDEEVKDYIARVQNSASRMQTLIDDLLSYSRVTTRAQPFIKVDLNRVLKDVISDLEVRIEQTKGLVEVGNLPTIMADPTQMRQLFQNIIGNALKFHRKGIDPVVKVEGKVLEGIYVNGVPACQVSITDNGIGFDEKYLDRIFTIFQRLHGRHEYEGTGIGLAVCRKIVDRHNGMVTARSKLGQGSTFSISLPIKQNLGDKL